MNLPSVKWDFWLCKKSNMGQITKLSSMHNKSLQLMLNRPGTLTGWLHLEDEKCQYVEIHKTCILAYRNNDALWSGPIYDIEDQADNMQNAKCNITAMGWFELLNKREVHTGFEWKEMAVKASGRTVVKYPTNEHEKELEGIESQYNEVLAEKFYIPKATESAQQLFYSNVPMAEIANDLLIRANIDVPTGITIGETAPTKSINHSIQQFENVGQQITKLTAIESGFDFQIDPLTKKFNTYKNEIFEGNETILGLGRDRGPGVKFTFPGNCLSVNRKEEGTRTQNRIEAIGQYSLGKAESIRSVEENGLFEASESLPEVTHLQILNAFASVETLTLEKPFTIITFNPKSVAQSDIPIPAVPRFNEDYEIGDVVYTTINKGKRFQVGTTKSPQAVRVFGANIGIEDSGSEVISSVQTTYSGNV